MGDESGRADGTPAYESPQGLTFLLLVLFSFLAYLVTPWWIFAETARLRWIFGLATAGLCVTWARMSSGTVTFSFSRRDATGILLAGSLLLALNFLPLSSELAWKGDEDFHVSQTIRFSRIFRGYHPWSTAALAGALGTAAALAWLGLRERTASRKLVAAAMVLAIGILSILTAGSVFPPPLFLAFQRGLLRYPFVEKYFSAIPVVLAYPFFGDKPPEILLRAVPFASILFLSWYLLKKFRGWTAFPGGLLVLSIGTCPLLYYYSSLLYLEMPCVLLMAAVCFSANELLKKPASQLPAMPSWIALILLGFLKETTIPFLLSFLFCRWLSQGLLHPEGKRSSATERLRGELGLCFCVLLPYAIFLFSRIYFGGGRGYEPHFSNLLDVQAYLDAAKSFVLQFGPWLALSLGGLVVLGNRKEWTTVIFFLLSAGVHVAFHILDTKGYAGYGRFNLFAAPMIIVSGFHFLKAWSDGKRSLLPLALSAVIAVNLLLAPLHLDGSRKSGWNDPTTSVAEWTYPFRSAIGWIGEHHEGQRILIAGLDYPYPFISYYMRKPFDFSMLENLETREEKERFGEALERASSENYDALLYMVRGEEPSLPSGVPWQTEKVFANMANRLILYRPIK